MSTSVYIPAPKRIKSSSGGKHRKSGFDPKWTSKFKWLERVEIDGRVGLLCKVCKKHSKVPRSGKGGWCTEPCFTLRKDKVVKQGCEYFKALKVGKNAKCTSPQIVAEFLEIMAGIVEENVVENL